MNSIVVWICKMWLYNPFSMSITNPIPAFQWLQFSWICIHYTKMLIIIWYIMHYRNSDHYKRADSRKLRPHNGTPALPSLKLLRLMNRLSNRKTVRQLLFSVSFSEKKNGCNTIQSPQASSPLCTDIDTDPHW